MKHHKTNQQGLTVSAVIIAVLVLAIIAVTGFLVYRHSHPTTTATDTSSNKSEQTANTTSTKAQAPDIYAGWKTATSPRAGFSIKYPANWTYDEAVGSNDNVEHITIRSSNFEIAIDSYNGHDVANGGTPGTGTTCPNCASPITDKTFTVSKLGPLRLDTVKFTDDNDSTNAIVLLRPDSTYYIPSPTMPNVYTSFRGFSVLNSVQAYFDETPAAFASNPDLPAAMQILESLLY